MKKTTTQNEDLLRYVYGETTKKESDSLEVLSAIDSNFYKDLHELRIVKRFVDNSLMCPGFSTLKKIMLHAKRE